jgi:photosystem II stability/assembly factor-like uncharacterized protein
MHGFVLLLVILVAAFEASHAGAATSSTVVGATVPSATFLDASGCPSNTANVTSFGQVMPGGLYATSADCSVTFGSSNDTSSLRVAQADGTGSAMAHPTDTWTRTSGVSARYRDVATAGGTTWAVGSDGIPMRSLDGGATWVSRGSGIGAVLSVSVPSASVAWATGAGTTVQVNVTADTSGLFAPTAAAPTGMTAVRGVAALDANTAWVVGDGGKIRKTIDRGATWATVTSPVAIQLDGINAFDADSLVAWGTGGTVAITSDGTTWRNISIPGAGTLDEVVQTSDNDVIAVGGGGAIYTTANATAGSPTWTTRDSKVSTELWDVVFTSASNGYAVGTYGSMTSTTNGGATWTRTDVDTTMNHFSRAISALES